jgi:hypothetical protein
MNNFVNSCNEHIRLLHSTTTRSGVKFITELFGSANAELAVLATYKSPGETTKIAPW